MAGKIPENLKPSPMDYTVERTVPLSARRIYLAQNASEMSATDLRAKAEEAQISIAGAASKDALVDAVNTQVRGS